MTKITTTETPRPIEDAMHRAFAPVEITEADLPRLAELMAADWPTPANYLPKIKQQVTDILVSRGYPDPAASVFHRGQSWRTFETGERPEPGEMANPGWNYTRLYSEHLTPEREAADLYRQIIEVENALDSGDVGQVFAHTVRLGVAVSRFNLRRLHLKSVTQATKMAGGRRNSAHQTNLQHAPLREVRFEIMKKLVGTIGVDKAAVECQNAGLGNWEAVKAQWNEWKRKEKGKG